MDTIAAIATPPGMGGVAIIRISGDRSKDVLREAFAPARGWKAFPPRSHLMIYGTFLRDHAPVDEGLAVFMKGPHSYTGEDVVEFHCHGGGVPARMVLEAALAAGARMAEPGEFTKRAFLHGKMELSSAEAVQEMIASRSEAAAKVAYSQLTGRLGRMVSEMQDRLLDAVASIQVTVDFPEEDLDEPVAEEVIPQLEGLISELKRLLSTARMGSIYRDGIRCVLVGRPNAGKSSLLNALCGQDRAIVTAQAGTTRDTLEIPVMLGDLPVNLVDTAGIREAREEAERMGVDRALMSLETAQLVLLLLDGTEAPWGEEERDLLDRIRDLPHIVVITKSDLARPEAVGIAEGAIRISSITGESLDKLTDAIRELVNASEIAPEDAALSSLRHIRAVREALAAMEEALAILRDGMPVDFAVRSIQNAWQSLGTITGGTVDSEIVDRIFEKFCLGK